MRDCSRGTLSQDVPYLVDARGREWREVVRPLFDAEARVCVLPGGRSRGRGGGRAPPTTGLEAAGCERIWPRPCAIGAACGRWQVGLGVGVA